MEFLLGCDPEIFVRTKDKKMHRSAWGLSEGTKENPVKVDNGAIQVDGFALEFNIDPAPDCDAFVHNINSVMSQMKEILPKNLEFSPSCSAQFHWKHWDHQPAEAKVLGCTPDFNAYSLKENPKPKAREGFRTAGGHIHIGGFVKDVKDVLAQDHMIKCATLVKQLDFYLGLSSLAYDYDNRRRSMYGEAGCFRPKSYGVEYRTLSNSWIMSEERIRFTYNTTMRAINDLISGHRPWQEEGVQENLTYAIKYSIRGTADALLREAGLGDLWAEGCQLRYAHDDLL